MTLFQEDITIGQATNILRLLTAEYQDHLAYCQFCQPGKWLCPLAHDFLDSLKHWDARLVSLLPPVVQQEGGTR